MIEKCTWYQNYQEGLKSGENLIYVTWVVRLGTILGDVFGLFGESAAECEYDVSQS